jgi:HAD superfamily hydrolase (TIGR01509 family)
VTEPATRAGRPHHAVLFDMDGTLLDTERVSMRTWHESLTRFGLALDEGWYRTLIGRDWAWCERRVHETFAHAVDTHALAEDLKTTYERLIHADAIPLRPGAVDVLERLRRSGVPLALATSTRTELAHRKLERSGLARHFDVVIGGDQVRRGKPAPDIYRLAAEGLGHDPAQCVAVEDSGTGLQAALAAGATTVLVPDVAPPEPELQARAHAVVPELPAAVPHMENWLGRAL